MSAMDILVGWIEILTAGDDRTKSPSPTFIANLIIQNIRAEEGSPAAMTGDDMWFGDPKREEAVPAKDPGNVDLQERVDKLEDKVVKAIEALTAIVGDDTWGLEHEVYMLVRKTLAQLRETT
jgi:hypothetical protein